MSEHVMPTAQEKFQSYLNEGFDQIEGWPGRKESVRFMGIFKDLFDTMQEKGGVCKIGLHHGKYIIALHNILAPCLSLGMDLFEDQHRNIDGSGRGSREICEKNIYRYAANPDSITLMAADSLALTSSQIQDIQKTFGYFAFFSIDGGHTALHAARDFFTASALTSKNGIIILDDIFHPDWPGVTEGVFSALAQKASPFVPLFLTRKKLCLCHISVWPIYKKFIVDRKGNTIMKMVDFANYNIPSLSFGGEY